MNVLTRGNPALQDPDIRWLVEGAALILGSGQAMGTYSTYRSHVKQYTDFCDKFGLDP